MTEKWKHFKRIVFPGEVNPVRNPSPAIAGLETERGIRSRPTGRNPELFKNVIPLQPPARREQQGIISNGVNVISYCALGSAPCRPVRGFGVLDFKMKSEATVLLRGS